MSRKKISLLNLLTVISKAILGENAFYLWGMCVVKTNSNVYDSIVPHWLIHGLVAIAFPSKTEYGKLIIPYKLI
jgi:hypothetical protein